MNSMIGLTEQELLVIDGGVNGWLIAGGAVALIGGAATADIPVAAGGVITIIAGIVY